MKKILLSIFIIAICFNTFGQAIINRAGPANTVQDANLFVSNSFRVPVFADTLSANAVTSLDSCGKIIYTRDVAANWVRSCVGASSRKWVMQLPSGIPIPFGQAWLVGGNTNVFADSHNNAIFGTKSANGMYWKTNDTTRIYMGRYGIAPATGTSVSIGVDPSDSNRLTFVTGGGGGTNIYNSDGTLTADRTVTGAAKNLIFTGVNGFTAEGTTVSLQGGNQFLHIIGDTANFDKRVSYSSDIDHNSFTDHTLVDKDYVDGAVYPFDATVSFSVNANPNTGGTTFSPNTPQLDTKVYVSTIDGSLWTWNGLVYVIYTTVNWGIFGNAGTNPSTNFIGTTDSVDWVIKTKGIERARFNARGALGLGSGTDYGTSGQALITQGISTAPIWSSVLTSTPTWQQTLTAGSTLTTANTIDGGNDIINWNNFDQFNITTVGGTLITDNNAGVDAIVDVSSANVLLRAANTGSSHGSDILLTQPSITLRPNAGSLIIDTLTSVAGTKALRYNPTTGLVSYADTTAGGSGVTTLAAIGSSPNANGATISGSTLNLEPASASFGGVVTTATQTLAGAKTFSSIITASAGIGIPLGSGTNRDTKIAPYDIGVNNYAGSVFYPLSGTDVGTAFAVSPMGTGFSSTNKAQFAVYNTDVVADPTNTEFFGMRAIGSSGYVIGSGKTGTGSNRDMMFAAGWFTDGTTNANQLLLSTNGNVSLVSLAGTGSRTVLADASGVLSAPVSDRSVKSQIEPVTDALEKIMKLVPVNFEYKDGWKNYGQGTQIGFIAQDVQKVLPNSTFITPSTGKMGYNEIDLLPLTISALQQAIIRIETLENEVSKLRNK